MNRLMLLFLTGILLLSPPLCASDDEAVLLAMLNDFLAGASINDPAAHERFWADDLVYTSSGGSRFGKTDILEGMRAEPQEPRESPTTVYSAQDVRTRLYGHAAVVAFRLLGTSRVDPEHPLQYFNTGTFIKRAGEWRAVAWQATRIPAKE